MELLLEQNSAFKSFTTLSTHSRLTSWTSNKTEKKSVKTSYRENKKKLHPGGQKITAKSFVSLPYTFVQYTWTRLLLTVIKVVFLMVSQEPGYKRV